MPGVPDFYQGTEFWDLSLVDPDNRRPVDFAARAVGAARRWRSRIGPQLVQQWPDGRLKLAWTRQLLKLRTELAELFTDGDYQPLEVSGPHRDSRHRLRAAAWPRCRDHRRCQIIRAVHRRVAGPGRSARPSMARSTSRDTRTEAGEDELQLSRALPPPACRGAQGEAHRHAEAGAQGRSRCEPSINARRPPGIERPDGLAVVVPTTKVGSLLPRLHRWSEQIRYRETYENLPRRIFRRCKAQQIAVHQPRFVSSRLPRLRIATCAAWAKRCSSHGSTTSTFT